MKEELKRAFLFLIIFTVIGGILYPVIVTAMSQIFFPKQANGSIVGKENQKVGSIYVGQIFEESHYFWSRPQKEELKKGKEERKQYLKQTSLNDKEVPEELMTVSASKVDPNLSRDAVYFQIDRVAHFRGKSIEEITKLVEEMMIEDSIIGTSMVNVLELNLKLDAM